jgi:hypothetical protein
LLNVLLWLCDFWVGVKFAGSSVELAQLLAGLTVRSVAATVRSSHNAKGVQLWRQIVTGTLSVARIHIQYGLLTLLAGEYVAFPEKGRRETRQRERVLFRVEQLGRILVS